MVRALTSPQFCFVFVWGFHNSSVVSFLHKTNKIIFDLEIDVKLLSQSVFIIVIIF